MMENFNNINKSISKIEELKKFLLEYFKNKKVKIWLFGSRARGDNTSCSDIDIAIEGKNIEKDLISIKEIIEESNLPYKIDIINLVEASEYLKIEIKKEGILWKE